MAGTSEEKEFDELFEENCRQLEAVIYKIAHVGNLLRELKKSKQKLLTTLEEVHADLHRRFAHAPPQSNSGMIAMITHLREVLDEEGDGPKRG